MNDTTESDIGVLWEAPRLSGDPSEAEIADWAQAVLSDRGIVDCELAIKIVDEAESRDLNLRYREKDSATNVLSFPLDAGLPDQSLLLGDIAICEAVVRKEALTQGKTFTSHFAHMVVHGVLHLLGFDHIEASQAQEMEQIERQILSTMGVDDPYADVGIESVQMNRNDL